ncbi:MAG: hypothetical protein P8R37_12380 [Opitutae bacterium]|nr:hypothetical protein [Opitutae bacterium]
MVKFLQDRSSVPEELIPYVFTYWGGDQLRSNIEEVYAQNQLAFQKADVFLIELSSLKRIFYGEVSLCLTRFGSWKHYGLDAPSSALSAGVVRSKISKDELYMKLDQLVAQLGGRRVVFTGHLNSDKSGAEIETRGSLNRWLKEYCVASGHSFYDVSPVLRKRPLLFMDDDATHYTRWGRRLSFLMFMRAYLSKNHKTCS